MIKIRSSIWKGLRFILIVCCRALPVMFRFGGRIHILRLEYENKYLFEQSYIIIRYKFKNALWFKFGEHITLEKQIKILNLKNFDKEFDFVVYGLFRRKVYKLSFRPDHTLKTDNFKTMLNGLALEFNPLPDVIVDCQKVNANIAAPIIDVTPIVMRKERIEIQTNTYNQTEFI